MRISQRKPPRFGRPRQHACKNTKSRRISMIETILEYPPIPSDDLRRTLKLAAPDKEDGKLPHIGLVGDTYTITVSGNDTNDRFCVIDMHVPPGGGPGLHRHDFEETFIVLDGEIEVAFRGKTPSCAQAKPLTFHPTLRIASIMRPPRRLACSACALLRARTDFSRKSAYPSRRAPPLRPNWTRNR